MSRQIFNLLCALVSGLIAFAVGLLINKLGAAYTMGNLVVFGVCVAVICYILLMDAVFSRLKHICCDYDWATEIGQLYLRIPAGYRRSFWILFGFINLAFLFHTIHFLWGNEDWGAIRRVVDHQEALKDGSFSAYWLQELLFDGKILPVINNLWAFAGLSLAGVLLAIYWNLPEKVNLIVIFGLMLAVTPYTVGVLYSVKTSLGVCFLPAISLVALILAEKRGDSDVHTYFYNLCSILLFIIAIGTCMPVINFIGVAILGQMLLTCVYADVCFKDAARRVLQALVNLTAALMINVLILLLLKETNRLGEAHAAVLNLSLPLYRLPLLIKYAFWQFLLPLPFMDIAYKAMYGILVVVALFTMIFSAPSGKAALRGLLLLPLLILASLVALLFSADPVEKFMHISFFGLPFLYALSFVVIVRMGGMKVLRLGYVLAVLLIFMNFVRIAYAEKVWKFGWDAETKLAERIITRLEKLPDFDINRQYKLLQVGEMSLRAKYYLKQKGEMASGALLDKAFYPQGAAKEAYNFFYQTDFIEADADSEALSEAGIRDYLLKNARAWPAPESLFIHGNYIVLVLSDKALVRLQEQLLKNKL